MNPRLHIGLFLRLRLTLSMFLLLASGLLSNPVLAQFPKIEQGDIVPHDNRLTKPINKSEAGELTIVSFNVRNLGGRPRSFDDFGTITNLVNEADVAVFQEVGLGLLDKNEEISEREDKRLDAIEALLRIHLGSEWDIVRSPKSTDANVSSSNEIGLVAYRKQCMGYTASLTWDKFVDLGQLRDMAVFKLTLTKGAETQDLLLGSVHLKPQEPWRVDEMDKVANWILAQPAVTQVIVMGDFNWGYPTKSPTHRAEKDIVKLHDQEELFMPFRHISYLKKAKSTELRTNLGARKVGHFYDQFLMSKNLAHKMADGGVLLKDCGIVSLEKRLKKPVKKLADLRSWALEKYLKASSIDPDDDAEAEKALGQAARQAVDDASYRISDHRPIWLQLKVW